MSISVLAISFDAHDAARLAHFWAAALQRTVNDGATEDSASIAADTSGGLGALLLFHKVPEGKTVKNRVHFDLQATDFDTEAERLISLGAKQIRSLAQNDNRWIGFTDPEGNEFDLVVAG
ncbi:putative enzyme related to lactoylglutathione lyase [Mycobacterium sp. MAA66]|uniref:VOC family protein n=1 Tax=Mycobacterium sp. MAA66 TaxID=3156297 RepID=UPI003518833B